MNRGEVRNPITVLLLTFVSCGLYGIYWFFQIVEDINGALGEERFNPFKELVLSVVTCGAWGLWLQWRLSETAVELQRSRGIQPKLEPWMLFLTGLVGLFPFFMQAMLNETWQQAGTSVAGAGAATSGGGGGGAPTTERDPAEMSDDWVDRFEAMVDEMREHPRVAITHYWVGEPATDADIQAVEEELGFEFDERIKSFYKQANGLQFRWMDKLDSTYVEERDSQTTTTRERHISGDNDDAMGVIDILPLRETFVDTDYEDRIWFDWMNDSETEFRGDEWNLLEFSKNIRPFDPYSFYNSTAFFLGDGEPGTTVIMGDDHDATFTDSRITDLASYLELVLAHRGRPQPRRDEFGEYAGHRKPRVVIEESDFDQSPLPLDEVLPDRSYLLTDEDLQSGEPVRVSARTGSGGGEVRGTVLGVEDAPTSPMHWSQPTEFVEVDFDMGPVGYVVRPSTHVLRREDVYEQAVQDPAAFLKDIAGASSEERAEKLGKIGAGDNSSTGYRIETDEGEIDFLVNFHANRYVALLGGLETSEAVDALLSVIEALIEDGLDTSVSVSGQDDAYDPEEFEGAKTVTNGKLVGTLNGALGVLLMESYNDEPYDSVRAKFGDGIADRLAAVADALEGEKLNYSDFPMVEFFAAAVDDFPGSTELQVRDIGTGYDSEDFGLEPGRPILSG
ncbi:MAG: DUF4234 domain-containing protein [Myxococcota bacterium]